MVYISIIRYGLKNLGVNCIGLLMNVELKMEWTFKNDFVTFNLMLHFAELELNKKKSWISFVSNFNIARFESFIYQGRLHSINIAATCNTPKDKSMIERHKLVAI